MSRKLASPFRPAVVWLAGRPWFRELTTRVGRSVVSRFVAGETLEEAMRVAHGLRAEGVAAMLDHLGENVTAPEHAAQAANDYVRALAALAAEPNLDAAISVKLTQLGLDFSEDLCLSHMERVLAAADEAGRIVMIDMESHGYVDRTLSVFRALRERHLHVGVCLQSYLRRTAGDLERLPGGSMIRLVKGAYLEPEEVVFTSRSEVSASFRQLFATLLVRGHTVHVATHDPKLVEGAARYLDAHEVERSRVEFQMLYGVRRDLQAQLVREGYPVRVYVPYGTEWYPYLTRRLAERPANLWFFLSNLARSAK